MKEKEGFGQEGLVRDTALKKLEIVLKCDSVGSEEAVKASLMSLDSTGVDIQVIDSGVGSVSKSDLLMALTGSRLVIGFGVETMPKIEDLAHEQGIEIRLYDVIYKLIGDIEATARSLMPKEEEEEKIIGKAKVIALFKSSRKGVILGCEILAGTLGVGRNFRIISAMGPIYTGKIESLHIENAAVKEARVGQKAGLKISDFKKVKKGDLVECFEMKSLKGTPSWQPRAGVFRFNV
jgi:translation initiation factor IF-2